MNAESGAVIDRDYLLSPSNGRPIHAIIVDVCAEYEISHAEIIGPRRHRYIVLARQAAYYRCLMETGASLSAIGKFFGGRDHTTIAHGIKQHEKRMAVMNG